MNEIKLVKKAKKGDSEAFGKLYDVYVEKIYRFVFFKVRSRFEAEDITQQVFLKTWQNIKTYKPQKGAGFSSWLYRIARNSVIDHYRTAKDHVDIEDLKNDGQFTSIPDPGGDMDRIERFKKIEASLVILTDDERDVIVMKFIEELSNKEIGDVLDKNQGAIRVIQHRALKKLKSNLEKDE